MRTIALVREADAADERVKEAYRDVKESLRVSYVDVLFQAYAGDPKFLDQAWRRLRPSMLAPPFVAVSASVGQQADRQTLAWPVSDHAAALHARNYGENDVRKLREIVDVFWSTTPKLLVIANAIRFALSGEPIGGAGVPASQAHVERDRLVRDYRGVRIPAVDEREAPLRVRTAFDELQRSTGLPFVDTAHRAMGAYPDWLEVVWADTKPTYGTPHRERACAAIDALAREAAKSVPYPLNLSADAYAPMAEVNDAFCAALPGLLVDIAIARRGLGTEPNP